MTRTSKLSNVISFLFMSKARTSKRVQRLVDEVTSVSHLDCTGNKALQLFMGKGMPQNTNQEMASQQRQAGSLAVLAKVYAFPED